MVRLYQDGPQVTAQARYKVTAVKTGLWNVETFLLHKRSEVTGKWFPICHCYNWYDVKEVMFYETGKL